ncbi:Acyl transferase domain-containing protein [Prauserella aidingensis]|uniref:type I polyketide synthase n=1 Tax=Prauserella aidingensis TaxID=387890 RepID=UPI0020A421BB|nr:type I polyketide synthase [Prauserella aidingensis]MCP2256100.1 Acyl transferase domain-containing protein [Prauserella aidingensis]
MSTEQKLRDYLKKVTTDLRAVKRRLAEVEAAESEPVAVIGMACRYPGGVRSPEDLWRLVDEGRDATTSFPTDRGWPVDLHDPDGGPGTSRTGRGGFLHDAAEFDADLFGISPREALATDPQQRLLLEIAWEAFERAGLDPRAMRGSRTGVFAGLMYHDYAARLDGIPEQLEGFVVNGSAGSIASGRVSYTFGLEGPAVTVDTACSSSLVGLHWATRALRSGECSMALAGGVTVMSTPQVFVDFSRQQGLAPDGRCKSFGADADGTGWAEGAGFLLLERLSDAVANGHPVLAVVRGTAVNSDGASNGLTAPSAPAQRAVIRAALADSGLDPSDVDAVEAHGTGTRLGDPIEAQALLDTYGRDRSEPLRLGSIKSNIGHTQAAAGIAGIIKLVEGMRHETLPRTLHADTPSPHVDWSSGSVSLLTDPEAWPRGERIRRAGVSSFGVSGTNAHAVLEEPPAADAVGSADDAVRSGPALWPLSGHSADALCGQARRLAGVADGLDAADVGFTLGTARASLAHRAVVLGEHAAAVRAVADGDDSADVVAGTAVAGGTAFVFTGQGSQRAGMGATLAEAFPAFGAAWHEVLDLLPEPVREVVENADLRIDDTEYAQPAIFAFEVALARLFESWGVTPDIVIGHSVGEVAAAHVAGIFTLADATRLVVARGALMGAVTTPGAMAALAVPESEVDLPEGVELAAVNAAGSIVVSGDAEAVRSTVDDHRGRGVRATLLRTSHAFHSAHMDAILSAYADVVDGVPRHPRTVDFAAVAGTADPDVGPEDAAYWVANVRATVRFADGVARLGAVRAVEIGPDAALTPLVDGCVPAGKRDRDERRTVLEALARLHVTGQPVDWAAFHAGARTVPLPTYAFQRKRFWADAPATAGQPASDSLRYRVTWSPAVVDGIGDFPAGTYAWDTEVPGLDTVSEPPAGATLLFRPATAEEALERIRRAVSADVRLWCLADGPEAAAVAALGRVAALEHPDLWGGTIELEGDLDGRLDHVRAVVAGAGDAEDAVALRDSGPHLRRLTPAPARPDAEWRPAGPVLITGGTGGIGSRVAHWAVDRGATELVLTGRRGPDAPGAARLRRSLEERGAAVTIAACDVTDRDGLAVLLAAHPVDAVFHTAGSVVTRPLAETTADDLRAALEAKVTGARLLDELTGELSAFVLFSSIAGVWGSGGLGAYAAANALLDDLAERRRAHGAAALSVAWGPWGEVGMAIGETADDLIRRGLRPLPPETALDALGTALATGDTCVTVADVDWARFVPAFTARRPSPLLSGIPGARPVETVRPATAAAAAIGPEDAADIVLERVATVLGHDSAADVDPTRAFRDLGFDSLTSVELRDAVAGATGLRLPATVVFDHPSPAALIEHVVSELTGGGEVATTRSPAAGSDADPVVIVGMGCRFPGGVDAPESLWDLLRAGGDVVGPFPADRGWDLDALVDPDPDRPGTTYTAEGAFLDDAAAFDAAFFGVSPREAVAMDPQQRVLLEVTWEALERAGVDPSGLRGTDTAVFAGTNGQDYASVLADAPDRPDGYLGTGSAASVLSGRVSYALGLEGPTMTVDTACSSSLVALHLAARALRSGECSLALAGGVTIMATPTAFTEFARQRGLAADGRCKAYADDADGTGWGEGAGVLVLERLSDARRNGHPVLATVRGSAVNSDGASNGLTAPNGPAQQRVLRDALADAGLQPSEVDAVEGHGTGTRLGDPIEAGALGAVYDTGRQQPLWLGSVKSNIGHTQAAAGVAGVIKSVLALRHGILPRTLHAAVPSAHADWGAVALLRDEVPLPQQRRPGRVGVSSFGFSGTNAHVVLEQAVVDPPAPAGTGGAHERPQADDWPVALVVSGRSAAAARAQAGRLADFLTARPECRPADVAVTSGAARAAFDHRIGIVACSADEAVERLRAARDVTEAAAGRVAFVFTGQGSQRAGMGRGLARRFPAFAEAWHEVLALLPGDVREAIDGGEPVEDTRYAQPAIFAFEVAMVRLLESWGVRPDVVLGHSVGEIAAAYVAGVFTLADATRLVTERAELMGSVATPGAMAAIAVSEQDLPVVPGVELAAVNGPGSVVVSGDADAVDRLVAGYRTDGVRASRLAVSHAFHSAHMDGTLDPFAAVVDALPRERPRVEFVRVAEAEGDIGPTDTAYWLANVRSTVRFADGVARLDAAHAIEVGPEAALLPFLAGVDGVAGPLSAVATQRGDGDEVESVMRALAALWTRGVGVDWRAVHPGARFVELPTYAFQRDRYWPATRQRVDDPWRYTPVWREIPVRTEGPSGANVPGTEGATVLDMTRGTPADLGAALRDLPDGDRVWCLTHGAVAVGDETPDPDQAAIWGLGRVIALEQPDRWGGLIDVASPHTTDMDAVRGAMATGEDQVALRETMLAQRLVAAPHSRGRSVLDGATVLITGGTGGLGLAVAGQLRGAAKIVLLSRSGRLDDDARFGADVVVERADVTDRDALAAVVAEHRPNVVIHAAGTGGSRTPVSSLGGAELAEVSRAKVTGARLLDELVGDVDAFVLFSSIAGVWGSAQQGAYSAANAALHAVASARRARGLNATAVAWGPWSGTGMAHDAGELDALGRMGLRPLDPDRAARALLRELGGAEPVVVLADVDWETFHPAFTARRGSPLLSEQAVSTGAAVPAGDGSHARARGAGADTPTKLPAAQAVKVVREQAAEVLGHADVTGVGADTAFRDLGFDSLTAVELRNRIADVLGVRLPATVVFDEPTPRRLAALLSREDDAAAGLSAGAEVVADDDPVVIVGAACRFPGGVRSPEDLWRLVLDGTDAVGGLPTDRGWPAALYHPDPDHAGTSMSRHGGFLDDAAGFDAGFFGISPREALAMDPQQRQLLEVSWEALERAGIDPHTLRGSSTGVFAGANPNDYASVLAAGTDDVGGHLGVGNAPSVLSGRIAYTLGLEGPALSVDTACSSSLVALHLAGRALREGECDLALAGAATIMSTPGVLVEFTRQRAMSPDGRCRAFGAGADGTGWSEGVGMLVLARRSAAEQRGYPVLAVLRGTAVNSDGASNGLTAPNGRSQQRVIRAALADAGLQPSDVDVVEAHGTGTTLGDPIEAEALLAVYGRDRDRPLRLGSLKSNIGHAQAAAGAGGVLKTVWAMRHGILPRTLHADEPSPHVDWSSGAIELATEATDWPDTGRPRRAGVSSFGFSGTNAHVILEEPPAAGTAPQAGTGDVGAGDRGARTAFPLHALPLSAASPSALRTVADRTAGALGDPAAVARALATTRADLSHRAVVTGADRDELVAALLDLSGPASRDDVGTTTGAARAGGGVAFLFPGQGAQHAGVGRALAEAHPPFAAALDEVCAHVDPHLDRPLQDVLFAEPGSDDAALLDETAYTQPALFALEVALYRLVTSCGVTPVALLGHSVGGLAAAHVAGVLSVADAAAVVAARGRLLQSLPGGGAMLAVDAGEEDVRPLLTAGVDIAAVNGPAAVVVSGAADEVDALAEAVPAPSRRLRVSHAFHSSLVEPVLDEFRAVVAGVDLCDPDVPVISDVTGKLADPGELTDPEYWVRHMRNEVRFAEGVRSALDAGADRFLEIGPGAALTAAARGTVEAGVFATVLRPRADEVRSVVDALAELYVDGEHVDWSVLAGKPGTHAELPTYPFEHTRYWPALPDTSSDRHYVVEYRSVRPGDGPSGHWAVLGDACGLRAALADRGVSVGDDPTAGPGGGAPDGVVVVDPPDETHVLDLLRRTGAPLWIVGGDAGAHALGRVAALEQPSRWGGAVEVDEPDWSAVATVLGGTEDQLRVRGSDVEARRIVRAEPGRGIWSPQGTVLVTGGTGALGGHVARGLVNAGAEKVVLAGRSGPTAPSAAALREELGERAVIVACDVTDRTALTALLAEHPVDAVVHAAGVAHLAPVDELTDEELAEVSRAKVTGARLLDELVGDVDAFVLFSSIAGVWGSGEHAAYAAANARLDALALDRHRRGLPATAVAWGPWDGGGMAAGDVGDGLRRRGLRPLDPQGAVADMVRLVGDRPTAVVADVDWDVFAPLFTSSRAAPLLDEVAVPAAATGLGTSPAPSGTGEDGALADELSLLDEAGRTRRLLDLVRAEASRVLRTPSVDTRRGFLEIGFDSLTAVELRAALAASTGLSLPTTLVFDHPTPEALAEYLADELRPHADPGGELDRLEALVDTGGIDDADGVAARLRALADRLTRSDEPAGELADAGADELLDLIRSEFGKE